LEPTIRREKELKLGVMKSMDNWEKVGLKRKKNMQKKNLV